MDGEDASFLLLFYFLCLICCHGNNEALCRIPYSGGWLHKAAVVDGGYSEPLQPTKPPHGVIYQTTCAPTRVGLRY